MAGLIQQRMAAQPQPDEEQGEQPGAPDEQEGTEGAQPQPGAQQGGSQQDYERVVLAGMKAIYAEGVSEHLIAMMKQAPNPAQGLAQATLAVMTELYRQSNNSMPPAVVVPAAREIMQLIAEIGEAGKVLQPTPDLLKQAMSIAAAMFMKQRGIDPRQAMQQRQQQGAQPGAAPQQPQFKPVVAQAQPGAAAQPGQPMQGQPQGM